MPPSRPQPRVRLCPGRRWKGLESQEVPGSGRSWSAGPRRWSPQAPPAAAGWRSPGQARPTDPAGWPRPVTAGRPRGGGRSWHCPPIRADCVPFLSRRSLSLPLTRLSRGSPSRAMASALSYVSKFKSFVILFITPLLLLPLVILTPAKVSCISADPGRPVPAAGTNPGALSWSAELGAHSGAPGAR